MKSKPFSEAFILLRFLLYKYFQRDLMQNAPIDRLRLRLDWHILFFSVTIWKRLDSRCFACVKAGIILRNALKLPCVTSCALRARRVKELYDFYEDQLISLIRELSTAHWANTKLYMVVCRDNKIDRNLISLAEAADYKRFFAETAILG